MRSSLFGLICPAVLVFAAYSPTVMAQRSTASPDDVKLTQRFGDQFELTNEPNSTIRVLNYNSPQDLRVCNLIGRGGSFQDEGGIVPLSELAANASAKPGAMLVVSYGDRHDRLQPGECDRLRSQRVALSLDPSSDIDSAFVGSVVTSGAAPKEEER